MNKKILGSKSILPFNTVRKCKKHYLFKLMEGSKKEANIRKICIETKIRALMIYNVKKPSREHVSEQGNFTGFSS